MKKLTLLIAVGVGYVLGTRAGRERYEQIKSTFLNVKDDPRVQSAAATVAETAKEQAPVVKDKVTRCRVVGGVRRCGQVAARPVLGVLGRQCSRGRAQGAAQPREHRSPGQPVPAGRPAVTLRPAAGARRRRWRR